MLGLERLKEVLPKIVSKEQGAFLQGRTMVDGFLYANECIDDRIRQGRPGVMCKLDLEKAYNHVNWEFLMYVLRRCGFGVKWSGCEGVFSLASFSVLINGVSRDHFGCCRGIRQGDPLSPLLFFAGGRGFGWADRRQRS